MALEPIHCPNCDGSHVIKHGKTLDVKHHYCCQDPEYTRRTFIQEYVPYAAFSCLKDLVNS